MGDTKKIRKLLTLEDLEQFYSTKKRSFRFSAENENEAVVVQLPATITFSESNYDPTLGLLPVHLASCHIGTNRNKSNISEKTMTQAIPSVYNRPILGYIHKLEDGSYDFAGHEMFINDDGEVEYEEIAVGTIPESCNPNLVYNEDNDKTYLELDGFIYEEYTRAADIIREKKQSKVSVELNLLEFSYDAKSKYLSIDKFYFSGITILGVSRDGSETPIGEGMIGSNIKLKDFSKANNSMFNDMDEDGNLKLIETLEKLNTTLSKLNIYDSYGKEETVQVDETILVNEEVVETEEATTVEETVETAEETTEETTETVTENESDDPVEDTPEVEEKESEETVEDTVESETEAEDVVESVTETEEAETNEVKFSKTFELSHDDIRGALYTLLQPYEETDNDWFWIMEVFNDYFVYQGLMGNLFGQKYTVDGDNVAFDGERYELFIEYLTASEKVELESMRANYSSISAELNSYKEAEMFADKMTVFEDDSYANYLETAEFKALMEKENVMNFTKEELTEKADAALGRLVKANKTFAFKDESKEEKKPAFFAFSKIENNTSFLDGLLKNK